MNTNNTKVRTFSRGVAVPMGFQICEIVPEGPQPPTPKSVLQYHHIIALRQLEVNYDDAEVVVSGRVKFPYYKELAVETVRPLIGSRKLIDHIEVAPA